MSIVGFYLKVQYFVFFLGCLHWLGPFHLYTREISDVLNDLFDLYLFNNVCQYLVFSDTNFKRRLALGAYVSKKPVTNE